MNDQPAAVLLVTQHSADGRAASPDDPRGHGVSRYWDLRNEVRESHIIHLQDPGSFEAVIYTVWAWLYGRSTIVDWGLVNPGRELWRRRLLVKTFGGSTARYADRIIVQDQKGCERILLRNVEPQRVVLSPPAADLVPFYLQLYKDIDTQSRDLGGEALRNRHLHRRRRRSPNPFGRRVRSQSSPNVHMAPLEVDSPPVHRRWGILVAAALIIGLLLVALVTPISGAIDHQLAVSFFRQRAPYTAVSLPQPRRLPADVSVGRPLRFTFAISNHHDSAVTYRYAVTETGSAFSTVVLNGNERIGSARTVNIPLVIRAEGFGPDLTIRVTVLPGDLSVAFHTQVTHAG